MAIFFIPAIIAAVSDCAQGLILRRGECRVTSGRKQRKT
jgi:hypothetical protein